jgi:hypothetical protein
MPKDPPSEWRASLIHETPRLRSVRSSFTREGRSCSLFPLTRLTKGIPDRTYVPSSVSQVCLPPSDRVSLEESQEKERERERERDWKRKNMSLLVLWVCRLCLFSWFLARTKRPRVYVSLVDVTVLWDVESNTRSNWGHKPCWRSSLCFGDRSRGRTREESLSQFKSQCQVFKNSIHRNRDEHVVNDFEMRKTLLCVKKNTKPRRVSCLQTIETTSHVPRLPGI